MSKFDEIASSLELIIHTSEGLKGLMDIHDEMKRFDDILDEDQKWELRHAISYQASTILDFYLWLAITEKEIRNVIKRIKSAECLLLPETYNSLHGKAKYRLRITHNHQKH